MTITIRPRYAVFAIALGLAAGASIHLFTPVRVQAQDNLTPGMLFGPLWVGDGQHLELCAANLGEGDIKAVVHFRNTTTGEITAAEEVILTQGGGNCAYYTGQGRVVGMARGDGRASDWVSPSNALISTMSVVNNSDGKTLAAVLGNAKLWLRGL
ncbi:MAG: hypothetical protein HYX27_26550 [Acidobacteria bacterium]|nr:hypothetical protein [Acidobacteriota bacterium]